MSPDPAPNPDPAVLAGSAAGPGTVTGQSPDPAVADAVSRTRLTVADLHAELVRNGLVAWTSGNVSARVPGADLLVIKPSGVAYADLTAESMVVCDLTGTRVSGELSPSSDTDRALRADRRRGDRPRGGHDPVGSPLTGRAAAQPRGVHRGRHRARRGEGGGDVRGRGLHGPSGQRDGPGHSAAARPDRRPVPAVPGRVRPALTGWH